MYLNSDIYTQAVSLKLRNKDNKLYRILKASLRKIKVPTISKISEKQNKPNKNEFLVNKIRNNIISFMFRDDDVKDPLSSLLLDFYPLADNIKIVRNKKSSALTVALTNSLPSQSLDEPERMHVKNLRAISLKSYVHR
jgi:citrate lyase alpha subunit